MLYYGSTFITEGAIPFASADPGRVIPSIIVGSAIAGALTMVFGIGLSAPHGGIFVIPIISGSPYERVSVVTRNLKEAGGKTPVRGTRTSYKARYHWVSLQDKTKPFLPKVIQSK